MTGVNNSTSTSALNTQTKPTTETESNSGTKALEDAKKNLTKLMENSGNDATREALQKAIGNIDKKLNPQDESDSVQAAKKTETIANSGTASTDTTASTKKTEDDPNKGVKDAKKTLEELADKTTDAKTKKSLQSAIDKMDEYLNPNQDSTTSSTSSTTKTASLNKNVSDAFDTVKDTMNSLAEKYGGTKDIENSLAKMEKYLNSSSDSDADKLNKMKDILSDTFDNYDNVKVDGDFFQAKKAAQQSIDSTVDNAQNKLEASSTGVTISEASKTAASSDASSSTTTAKSSFDPMIPSYMKNLDFNSSAEDFYAQLLNGSTGFNAKG